jgi:glycosyltransferase involved in cell wall biosynthesis
MIHVCRSRTAHSGNATLQRRIDSKYGKLREKADELAARRSPASNTLEAFTWQHPFTNAIADTSSQGSILVIVPWLYMGGADIGALRQIETLTKQGFRVTVVCTLYKAPEGLDLRPDMMQWTHDIHVLPSFLRAAEFPRYIVYLAKTRQAKTVFMSNSMLAYEMLPALREQLPDAVFVDYQHNEAYNNWKQGGYPTYSILHQRYLDRTISCSHRVKQWMVERGHDAARIGVVKLGVDLRESAPANVSTRAQLRRSLFKADSKTSIILSVARLDPQKRSTLLPDIIQRLVQDHGYSCRGSTKRLLMVMVGAGDLREALEAKVAALGLENCFSLTGIQAETAQYYQSADLFLLPSMSEGISVAVSEAMAAGLPVVAADAGALGEQVGLPSDADQAGLVVAQTLDDAVDAPLYASAVAKLLQDRPTRLRLAQNGLQRVQHSDWHQTLLGLLPELQLARAAHTYPRSPSQLSQLPHPAAQLSVQTQLLENRGLVDLSQIQNSLQAATRSPYGKQLQEACPDNAVSLRWIDALEEKPFCVENAQNEVLALQQSALEQCGSWCVWDLRAEAATGWIFK